VPDAAVDRTVKDVVESTPALRLQLYETGTMPNGVLVMVQVVVSLVLKPLPEIETVPPTLTKVGLSVIVGLGLVTVNVATAESPALPVTLMEYTPNGAGVKTWKDPDMEPLAENVHDIAVRIDPGVLERQL
jgi:hypothetical protein